MSVKCHYSGKYEPLLKWKLAELGSDEFMIYVENNFEDASNVYNKFVRDGGSNPPSPTDDGPQKLNQRQTKIVIDIPNDLAGAYFGNTTGYNNMLKTFKREMIERSRMKVDFNTGEFINVDPDEIITGSLTRLNRNILEYKIQLINNLRRELSQKPIEFDETMSENELVAQISNVLNGVKNIELTPEGYDSYIILSKFDYLIQKEIPFIEINKAYLREKIEGIHKYTFKGANVQHFTGWVKTEYADSMDQASDLVKIVLDYLPEVDNSGKPIIGTSITLSGFLSAMSSLREAILYKPGNDLLEVRNEIFKGDKMNLGKVIDAYIKYLKARSETRSINDFYEKHVTYLVSKLNSLKKYVFDEDSSTIDPAIRSIMKLMFLKNVQVGYRGYALDSQSHELTGKDLKANLINRQAYSLMDSVKSAVYKYKQNKTLWKTFEEKWGKGENTIRSINGVTELTSESGHYFRFKTTTESISPDTNFTFDEIKELIFDLFDYVIPEDYERIGSQVNPENNWDSVKELGTIVQIGIMGVRGSIGTDTYGFPDLSNFKKSFMQVGKVLSIINGSSTTNVIKSINGKSNYPLYGLTSLAYNFNFLTRRYTDEDSLYSNSFLLEKEEVDFRGRKHFIPSIVGSPVVRSDIYVNKQLKSPSKATVSELARISILNDFLQNVLDSEQEYMYLQNATFADKNTHFLVSYALDRFIPGLESRTLREAIIKIFKTGDSFELFSLAFDSRRKRIKKLVKNILDDYADVFDFNFQSLDDIESVVKKFKEQDKFEGNLHEYVKFKFASKNVNFYENIHLSKGVVNPVIKEYYSLYGTNWEDGSPDQSKFYDRLQDQRKRMIKDLISNNFVLNVNSDGSLVEKMGDQAKDWVDPITGNIELARVTTKTGEKIVIDKYNLEETLLDPELIITLNPVLEAYYMSDILLSNEYNELMIGGVYAHGKGDEAKRLIAQIKRSVIFGATIHPFAQGMNNGVASEIKVAVIDDWPAAVQNIVGEEKDDQASMDGAGISSPIEAILENNSLLDARVGWDKKTIMHDNDDRYGRPTLLKWAVYAMTNARRRLSTGSVISQEILFRNMHNMDFGSFITDDIMNDLLNSFNESVYIKDPYSDRYYKLQGFEDHHQILIEVDEDGNYDEDNPIIKKKYYESNTLYSIDQAFGGAWSMKRENDTLVYGEANNYICVNLITKYPKLKDYFIAYAVNSSAIKVGAGNVNHYTAWQKSEGLKYITMSTEFGGVQMDAEHDLDETEVTEMTQMISALSESGYTSKEVEQIYKEIGQIIHNSLEKYEAGIKSNNPEDIYRILGEEFVRSFELNDRDTLGLAQAFVQKANKALKEKDPSYKIPLSAKTVNGIYISTVSSLLTKKGIRRKYDGFAGVLTPSYNSIQYFNTGRNGAPQLYEDFIKTCKEKLPEVSNWSFSLIQDIINNPVINIGDPFDPKYIVNPFLEEVPIQNLGKIGFEDTVIIYNEQTNTYEDPIYIDRFERYDYVKHLMDLTGKRVYLLTSRPRNLKGTDTVFKVNGYDYSMYDVDSVRASFYVRRGINEEFVNNILSKYVDDPSQLTDDLKLKLLQQITQNTLRNLKKGRPISIGGFINVVATDVTVIPAQCITGRYHSKEFMLNSKDKIDDILQKKETFFSKKLLSKWQFPQYPAGINDTEIMDYAFFTEDAECFSVKVMNESQREKFLAESHKGYTIGKDDSILELGDNVYYRDEEITSRKGKHFYKIIFDDGSIQKLIICDDNSAVNDIRGSMFFDYERVNYKTKRQRTEESEKFIKDINRRAKQMYRSFEIQQHLIGTRIPAQAMQSFMPMDIIGWTDSFVNEIFVPVMQMYLQGSDLDIDKVFNLGFEIRNGKIAIDSKLIGDHDFRYVEVFELTSPNGITYEYSDSRWGTKITSSEIKALLGTYEANPNRIQVLNRIYDSPLDTIVILDPENVTAEEKELFLHFVNKHSTTKLSDKAKDAALKNKAVWHMYMNVITNPENQINANISIDSVMAKASRAAELNESAKDDLYVNSDNPMTKFIMQVQNMVGKEVIGIVAVSLKQFFAKTAFYNQIVNESIGWTNDEKAVEELLKTIIKQNPLNGRSTTIANLNLLDLIDDIEQYPEHNYFFKAPYKINDKIFVDLLGLLKYLQQEANENDAALSLSALLSLATDNAKELKLSKLNATSNLVDIYTYLLSLGSSVEDIAKVMTSKSFNYAAKLSEGDVFSYYSKPIRIEKALGFLIGEDLPFNIDKDVVTYYFGLYDPNKSTNDSLLELYELLKTPDGIIKCEELIKQIEEELKTKKRRSFEEGYEDENESDEEESDEYWEEDDYDEEGGKRQTPNRNIATMPPNTKEKQQMLYLLNMILDKENFLRHNPNEDLGKIKIIKDSVLPGVEEQQIMGFMAGINTGLKTDLYKKYRFKKRIENYINKVKSRNTDSIQKDNIENRNFVFYDFLDNSSVQEFWINWMEERKINDNVLRIITFITHFNAMLQTWRIDERALNSTSIRYNLINWFADQIVPNSRSSLNELEFKQVVNFVDELLIANWLRQSGLRFKVPAGVKYYKPTRNLDVAKEDIILNFESSHDYATFKYLMENWIIPELKKDPNFKDNDFIKALTMSHSEDVIDEVVRQFYHLPIEMMNISSSSENEIRYNNYLNAFNDISNIEFNGWKLGDLFYMYNLIVHKDSFGQKTLTRLFESIVASDRDDYLVNKYYKWLTDLDGLSLELLKKRIILEEEESDVKYRIKKYVPTSKIKADTNVSGQTDYTFNLPLFDESPKRIQNERFVPILLDNGTFTTIPLTYYLSNIIDSDNNVIIYEESLLDGIIDGLYSREDLINDWDEVTADYFINNAGKLNKAKAFIFNGKIFINRDKANALDYVHEIAHVILAEMKWSNDEKVRELYYKLVSQVSEHKLFDKIAKYYPNSHGSDLQEEVLVNIFEMYLNNEVVRGDEVFEILTTHHIDDQFTFMKVLLDVIKGEVNYENIDFTALVEEMHKRINPDDESFDLSKNGFVINKSQKIASLKDKLIKAKLLEIKCK